MTIEELVKVLITEAKTHGAGGEIEVHMTDSDDLNLFEIDDGFIEEREGHKVLVLTGKGGESNI